MMSQEKKIRATIDFVQKTLKNAEGGHDWFHIERVQKTAKTIAERENVDLLVVELAALLHDIGDPKFHNGDESVGSALAQSFMENIQINRITQEHVINIIKNMSFKNSLGDISFESKEMNVVQDADRLDAIGAIGIARAFNYGGYKNRKIYDPLISPKLNMTKEEYKKSTAPTINHFYEKLLLLKDKMKTKTGKELAGQRHDFMQRYLEQFYQEWEGES